MKKAVFFDVNKWTVSYIGQGRVGICVGYIDSYNRNHVHLFKDLIINIENEIYFLIKTDECKIKIINDTIWIYNINGDLLKYVKPKYL